MFTSWRFILPGSTATTATSIATPLDQDYDLVTDFDAIGQGAQVTWASDSEDGCYFQLDESDSDSDTCCSDGQEGPSACALNISYSEDSDNEVQVPTQTRRCDCWLCTSIPWDELSGRHYDTLKSFRHEFKHCSIPAASANAIHNAGRPDAGHTFKDIRSSDKARLRTRSRNYKYYDFKVIDRGVVANPKTLIFDPEQKVDPETITKKVVFQEAQKTPRPVVRHRRPRRKDRSPWSDRVAERMSAGKHHIDTADRIEDAGILSGSELQHIRMDVHDEDWWALEQEQTLSAPVYACLGELMTGVVNGVPAAYANDALTDAEFAALSMDAFVDVVPVIS